MAAPLKIVENGFEKAEEFIAAITQHIPDKHSRIGVRGKLQMLRYYGWYSNRSRGERTKARPELVELANMSVSSFHQHFKSVTSMTPLQFQKALRLQEARRLMFATMTDATTASWKVGYQSASQFSREYGRFFVSAPTRGIARLRELSTLDPIHLES